MATRMQDPEEVRLEAEMEKKFRDEMNVTKVLNAAVKEFKRQKTLTSGAEE